MFTIAYFFLEVEVFCLALTTLSILLTTCSVDTEAAVAVDWSVVSPSQPVMQHHTHLLLTFLWPFFNHYFSWM